MARVDNRRELARVDSAPAGCELVLRNLAGVSEAEPGNPVICS